MDTKQQHALELRNTDLQGVMKRFNNDEQQYQECLKMFLEDQTMTELNAAITSCEWDGAFTAAHALKGIAGNMGFVPLMHSTGQLLIAIRGGRMKEIKEYAMQVNSNYRDIVDAIKENFM